VHKLCSNPAQAGKIGAAGFYPESAQTSYRPYPIAYARGKSLIRRRFLGLSTDRAELHYYHQYQILNSKTKPGWTVGLCLRWISPLNHG